MASKFRLPRRSIQFSSPIPISSNAARCGRRSSSATRSSSPKARGLITQYEVLDGNPADEQHVVASLERHKQTFGDVPKLYGSDRGFFSEQNVTSCKQQGVKVVCIPQRGGTKAPERETYEKSREFKDGQRFRAGIEGRISVLFRGRGMKRCLAEGRERFELLVGAAVFVNNLL